MASTNLTTNYYLQTHGVQAGGTKVMAALVELTLNDTWSMHGWDVQRVTAPLDSITNAFRLPVTTGSMLKLGWLRTRDGAAGVLLTVPTWHRANLEAPNDCLQLRRAAQHSS